MGEKEENQLELNCFGALNCIFSTRMTALPSPDISHDFELEFAVCVNVVNMVCKVSHVIH